MHLAHQKTSKCQIYQQPVPQTTHAGVMITAHDSDPVARDIQPACPPAHILVDEPRCCCCKNATPTGKKETPAKLNPEVHLS